MFSAHTAENKGCIFLQLSCNYVWLWLSSGAWDINWIVWQLLETSHKRKLAYAFCPVLCLLPCFLDHWWYIARLGTRFLNPDTIHILGLGDSLECAALSLDASGTPPLSPTALWQSDMSPHCLLSSGVGWMPLRTADLEQPTWDQEWRSHWFPWE